MCVCVCVCVFIKVYPLFHLLTFLGFFQSIISPGFQNVFKELRVPYCLLVARGSIVVFIPFPIVFEL